MRKAIPISIPIIKIKTEATLKVRPYCEITHTILPGRNQPVWAAAVFHDGERKWLIMDAPLAKIFQSVYKRAEYIGRDFSITKHQKKTTLRRYTYSVFELKK